MHKFLILPWILFFAFSAQAIAPSRKSQGEACFYAKANYEGRRFCMKPGTQMRNVGSAEDPISSITLRGPVRVMVFNHSNFVGGGITVVDNVSNVSNLPSLTNHIAAIAVLGL